MRDADGWRALTQGADIPSPRVRASMAYDSARSRVVLFGGSTGASDTWELDGENWTRIETADALPPRIGASMVFDVARGVVVLFGGEHEYHAVSDTWEYDGSNWRQIETDPTPPERAGACMVYDPIRQRAVLFGGYRDVGRYAQSDTWEYGDGQLMAAPRRPKVRSVPHDPTRDAPI